MSDLKFYNYEGIELSGSNLFIKNTIKALDYIKNVKCEFNYLNFVKNNIGMIQQNEKSGMKVYTNPPIFQVGYRTFTASVSWYASAIVHDANHSRMYKDNLKYYGKEAEEECLLVQVAFLQYSNGPKSEINYIKKLIKDEVDYYSDPSKVNW